MELMRAAFDLDYSYYSRVRWVTAFSAHVSLSTPEAQHPSDENQLYIIERKILRKIYGPTQNPDGT